MKKIITMIMVMCMVIGTCAMSVDALCTAEDNRPDIVGMEHFEAIKELNDRYNENDMEIAYTIEMVHVEGYWCVVLTGEADEYYDYRAYGMYDHMPNEEEIDILWANRMLEDEMNDLFERYGF